MLKIGYNAVYNYVYREKSLIARICSSPMSHVLSDIQCSLTDVCASIQVAHASSLCLIQNLRTRWQVDSRRGTQGGKRTEIKITYIKHSAIQVKKLPWLPDTQICGDNNADMYVCMKDATSIIWYLETVKVVPLTVNLKSVNFLYYMWTGHSI